MIGRALIALAFGTFALGIAEFSMMGILTIIAADLHTTIPQAGDFISAYALGVSIGAPLPLFFRRHSMKTILLGLAVMIFIGNTLAAASQGYASLLAARFFSGLPHGGFFGVGAIVASLLAPVGKKATAVAVMVTGMATANLAGVPLATWITHLFTWRLTFALAACAGAATAIGVWRWLPEMPPRPDTGFKNQFAFLRQPGPWLIFLGTFLGQGSIYCWYSYMEPIMIGVTHIPAADMPWVMALTGCGMVLGNGLSGRLADRFRPALVSGSIALLMVPVLALIYFCSPWPVIALPLAFIGAGGLFGLGGPMQYLIVRFAPGGEMLGGAGIQIAFNVSNACAAFLGGLAIRAGLGVAAPALVGIPVAAAAAACLLFLHRRYRAQGA